MKDYRHFVVVKGVSDKEVLVGDPSVGVRVMTRTDFLQVWNGVYFAVGTKDPAKPIFNAGVQ